MPDILDVKRLSLVEKLQLMELLWDELRCHEEVIPVPDWQKQVLDERERAIQEGKATFTDWAAAKERITKRTS